MTQTKQRKNTGKMDGDESSGDFKNNPVQSDPKVGLITPRKPIRNYDSSNVSIQSTSESITSMMLAKIFTFLTKLSIYYTLKPRLKSRIVTYFILILILGLFRDYIILQNLLPKDVRDFILSFRVGDRSPFNMYTVKIGWFWTLVSLVPFMLFTRFDLAKREVSEDSTKKIPFFSKAIPAVVRLIVMTVIWYFSVEFFVFYSDINGQCKFNPKSNNNVSSHALGTFERRECKKQGHHWNAGFDISGHIFLMVFSNLVRFEEFKYLMKNFDEFAEFRYMELAKDRVRNFCTPYRFQFKTLYIRTTLYLMLFFLLTVVWDIMIFQTSLYYHSLLQKIIGLGWAVTCWFVTYRVIYPAVGLSV